MKKLCLVAMFATIGMAFQSNANAQETIFGLDDSNNIISIQSSAPTVGTAVAISGLLAGDSLVGIDFRAGTGQMYAIGSANNVYTLDLTTFGASLVGNFADGVNDDPAGPGGLSGNQFAFDFNPAFTPDASFNASGSFARIISDTDTNRVINGNTGEYLGGAKTDVFYPNSSADPNIQGIAYDNSVFGSTATTQFGIDTNQNTLVTIANNAGTLSTVGSLGNVFTGEVGFDISGVTNTAFASFETGVLGASELYTIDLGTGAVSTSLGSFGAGTNNIRSLAVVGAAVPEPGSASLLALGLAAFAGRRRRK
ncbi:DUF4394 domain-containing protein [Mariniblastus sp.]|nr:DUF4394 domain-containing protein [Mariniblastus sp.]